MIKGKFLVIGQFSLVGLIIYLGDFKMGNILSVALMATGIICGLSAIISMKLSVNIFPEVRPTQELINSGIYKYIRHPMYTAVILVSASFIVMNTTWLLVGLLVLLSALLITKLTYEEKLLLVRFPEYYDYTKKTKKLIPLIY